MGSGKVGRKVCGTHVLILCSVSTEFGNSAGSSLYCHLHQLLGLWDSHFIIPWRAWMWGLVFNVYYLSAFDGSEMWASFHKN